MTPVPSEKKYTWYCENCMQTNSIEDESCVDCGVIGNPSEKTVKAYFGGRTEDFVSGEIDNTACPKCGSLHRHRENQTEYCSSCGHEWGPAWAK
jgi:ribosomal protein L37E